MKSNSDASAQKSKKTKKSVPFLFKLFFPMSVLSVLQLFIFTSVLYLGGELSYIKKYAYNILAEKTENRKNYIENMFTQTSYPVYSTNQDVNELIADILESNNKTVDDIKSDKELDKLILSESAESIIYLLRISNANDAFIILDTGDLYGSSDDNKKAAIYLRDLDPFESSINNHQDIMMEVGNSDIAEQLDIALDFEWSALLDVGVDTDEEYSFYYKTIETAEEYSNIDTYSLGYWSGFSKISPSAHTSIKYTMPLVADDGTVYGVIGIGLMEKTILNNMPSNDFISSNSACYILGADYDNDDDYNILLHSGSIFTRLIGNDTEINHSSQLDSNLYNFSTSSEPNSIGSIYDMTIYNSDSPYKNEKWAVISVADERKILSIYTGLLRMLMISSAISLVLSLIVAFIISKKTTSPVKKITKVLNRAINTNTEKIVHFDTSGIKEFDLLSSAITKLQFNVREQSSRMSKIIQMVDIGIGVFMCDTSNESVFIGESFIKMFSLNSLPDKDIVISFSSFVSMMSDIDDTDSICTNPIFNKRYYGTETNFSFEISYSPSNDEEIKWYKFILHRDDKNVLGVVQDITKSVIEKRKIEYERDYDITTGLLNRRAYYNQIHTMFSNPKKLKVAAFIMVDLDNLKYVNDTYGHDFGDDYIKTAANILKIFKDYGGIVARLSGDEFNVFISGYNNKDEIRQIIDTVRHSLIESYCVLSDGTHYRLKASAGISWYPDDSDSYEMLMKYADFAMYTVKHSTKGNISEFNAAIYTQDAILINGIEEMNRIIDEQQIKYVFQNIISTKTGEIYGYEALMRPQSEILHSPLEFIRIARTGAKLDEIERLTWHLSFKYFREQIEKGNIAPNAKIFINSLTNCIMKPDDIEEFVNDNKEYLNRIVIEFLESDHSNHEYTEKKRGAVAKWNAMTALDDFGSGYNSEYALITYSPNIIKIDRSIINGCNNDTSRQMIIKNLIQIAKTKNILVLAEGVETYEEMKTVVEYGVDLLQGYYFGKPLLEPLPLDKKITDEILHVKNKKKHNKKQS
jgi:diguanylate cyclase (GGDEF)-like protein